MRTTAMITAGFLLGACLLAGCGSGNDKSAGSQGGYCKDLKTAAKGIGTFTGGSVPDADALATFQADVKKLAAEAPSAVSGDWKKVNQTLTDLTSALDDAGVKLDELVSAMSTGKLPDGVTADEMQALGEKVQVLASKDFDKATSAIDKHAKASCKVDLSLAG